MDQSNVDIMTSALFGDNSAMLNAVASLIARQHQDGKEHDATLTAPLLVLTNMPGKDSLLANVILGTANTKNGLSKSEPSNESELLVPSLEQVHALATANLLASTQRDIAKQLAEAQTSDHETPVKKNCLTVKKDKKQVQRDESKKKKEKTESKKSPSKLAQESSSALIINHLPSNPATPRALTCSFDGCNRKFAWLNHLKYHELTHTNNRQFKCPDESCGKTFFTAQRLNVHLRTHTGEKPFKCTHLDCGKTFATAGNLKNHERIHTGEQPFVCDHINCNRRFTEQSSLRKHKLTHSGDKPFECNICGKKFTQSGSRRQHLIRHHLDDEIRKSFKQEIREKSTEEEQLEQERIGVSNNNGSHSSNVLQTKTGGLNAVSCSPQVLVLNNAYPDLPTSESIVFSHGLSDHIVTVTTQSVDHPISESDSLSLSHSMLSSDGLHDETLHGKSDDLVVLSEAPIYPHEENPSDIVYTADMLDHEEVTHADYVSSQVDYSGDISHTNYSHHGEITGSDDFHHQDMSQSENYIPHGSEITVTEYVPRECIVSSYPSSKEISLDTDRDIAHAEFIGAEEVAVAQYSNVSSTSNLVPEGNLSSSNQTQTVESSETVCINTLQFEESALELSQEKEDASHTDYIGHQPSHSYMSSASTTDEVASVGEAEVTSHASHNMGSRPGEREIHMDPMMECDEEPDKH